MAAASPTRSPIIDEVLLGMGKEGPVRDFSSNGQGVCLRMATKESLETVRAMKGALG